MMLAVAPLTADAFAPFGDVLSTDGARHFTINEGSAERFDDLARVDLGGGDVRISIFVAKPRPAPIVIRMLEHHPLGTQAFMPLQRRDYLVVVAPPGDDLAPDAVRAFRASGLQGVNYHRGVWHHPLLVLEADSRFLVVDRDGRPGNLVERTLDLPLTIADEPGPGPLIIGPV